MDTYLFLKLLHVIGFAYWLGADLGVFYSSYFVADATRSADVRVATAKILFALDQAPRICMTMMLPSGTHLLWELGLLEIEATLIALLSVLCFGWMILVISLHRMAPGKRKTSLTTFDFFFRLALSVGLIGAGLYALFGPVRMPDWAAVKIAVFGALVGCGLIVRLKLRPFGPAFANLVAGNVDDADNAAIKSSLDSTRPFVLAIWAGLLVSTALGLHLI